MSGRAKVHNLSNRGKSDPKGKKFWAEARTDKPLYPPLAVSPRVPASTQPVVR